MNKRLLAGGDESVAVCAHLRELVSVSTRDAASVLVPRMVVLALGSKDGSHVVQKAIDIASPELQIALTDLMRGFVPCLATSKHGNHVIKKHIETVSETSDSSRRIAEEILADLRRITEDKFGCRIVQCLLKRLDSSNYVRRRIVAMILENASDLCWAEYGHFVVETLLDEGQVNEQLHIVRVLLSHGDVAYTGKGCFVVQKVFELKLIQQLLPQLSADERNIIERWDRLCSTQSTG